MLENKTIDITQEEMQIPEPVDFLQHYVQPHDKVSREVTGADRMRLIDDAHVMFNLCFTVNGKYHGGFAVAHPQINSDDPLRFFVTKDKEIIINPVIVNHTKQELVKMEGCLSFPDLAMIKVPRYNKVTVEYSVLNPNGTISERKTENMSGKRAEIFQHEIEHLDGKNIYQLYGEGF